MDKVIKSIANQLNAPIAKVNVAFERLKLMRESRVPKLHWELTELGKTQLTEENVKGLLLLIEEQFDLMPIARQPATKSYPSKKECGHCGLSRTNDYFGVSEHTNDGLTKWCVPCLVELNQSRHPGKAWSS